MVKFMNTCSSAQTFHECMQHLAKGLIVRASYFRSVARKNHLVNKLKASCAFTVPISVALH